MHRRSEISAGCASIGKAPAGRLTGTGRSDLVKIHSDCPFRARGESLSPPRRLRGASSESRCSGISANQHLISSWYRSLTGLMKQAADSDAEAEAPCCCRAPVLDRFRQESTGITRNAAPAHYRTELTQITRPSHSGIVTSAGRFPRLAIRHPHNRIIGTHKHAPPTELRCRP